MPLFGKEVRVNFLVYRFSEWTSAPFGLAARQYGQTEVLMWLGSKAIATSDSLPSFQELNCDHF